jgi:hypothetical protein
MSFQWQTGWQIKGLSDKLQVNLNRERCSRRVHSKILNKSYEKTQKADVALHQSYSEQTIEQIGGSFSY